MSCPVDYKTYTDTLQVTTAQFREDLVSELIVIQSSKSSLNLAPLYASALAICITRRVPLDSASPLASCHTLVAMLLLTGQR